MGRNQAVGGPAGQGGSRTRFRRFGFRLGFKRADRHTRTRWLVEQSQPGANSPNTLGDSRLGRWFGVDLRHGDVSWEDFVVSGETLEPVTMPASAHTNILFSSGTTGEPKAIPWNQTTPIKAAMDGRYHQDIHAGDVVAWPTNLGWMMGPWLIYAALLNEATIALYVDAPTTSGFVQFVEDAGVTMLGVVPAIVSAWRASEALEQGDWTTVRVISSTGEASNADDYQTVPHNSMSCFLHLLHNP